MNKAKYFFLFMLALTILNPVYAATTATPSTTISSLGFYNNWGSGLVQIEVASPAVGCEGGFFIKNTDDGYDSILSALLSAYHTAQNIIILGLDDNLQAGLGGSGPYCKLYYLEYK